MIRENRECVTIHPFISLDGEVLMCHVIFKGTGINNHMAPAKTVYKIPNLYISTTESGVQDHNSLYDSYVELNNVFAERKSEKPICILTDGHSSRFDADVMNFNMVENENYMFVSPPDTTGVTQVLDQINKSLHFQYIVHKKPFLDVNGKINRKLFMEILAEA